MKRITVKQDSGGHKLLMELKAKKKEIQKRMSEKFPDESMKKIIEAKVEETDKCNKDNNTWDKASFRLGMYSMYFILNKKL